MFSGHLWSLWSSYETFSWSVRFQTAGRERNDEFLCGQNGCKQKVYSFANFRYFLSVCERNILHLDRHAGNNIVLQKGAEARVVLFPIRVWKRIMKKSQSFQKISLSCPWVKLFLNCRQTSMLVKQRSISWLIACRVFLWSSSVVVNKKSLSLYRLYLLLLKEKRPQRIISITWHRKKFLLAVKNDTQEIKMVFISQSRSVKHFST